MTIELLTYVLLADILTVTGVGNLRPAGQIRPADSIYLACGPLSKLRIYPARDLFT